MTESNHTFRKGILLDRDGVLLVNKANYVKSIEEAELIPGVEKAVAKLWESGYVICVVTNQAGVGKKLYTSTTVNKIHDFIEDRLRRVIKPTKRRKIHWYFCPHKDEDKCSCRKPKPGLLLRAMEEHRFSALQTWMVGDATRDILAGARAKCRTALVRTGMGKDQVFSTETEPQAIFSDLVEFVENIIVGPVYK